jgi:hypothetical protein
MPATTALVPTANAEKYMKQLCKHWSHKLDVELAETTGIVRFGQAVATMEAKPDGLAVKIEAESGEVLEQMKGVVASHLDRFAFREAPLSFDWT